MKILILYFSGTGVTAKFAYDIADQLMRMGHIAHCTRIKKGSKIHFKTYQLVGYGAPAYSFRAPRLATKIIKSFKKEGIPYFLFCTSGGMPGNTLWNLHKSAKNPIARCIGHASATGITNLRSWMPLIDSTSNNKQSSFQDLWYPQQNFIENYCQTLQQRFETLSKFPNKGHSWAPRPNIGVSLWSFFFTWRWQMQLTVGKKFIDKQRCSKCGLCATKICPTNTITYKKGQFPTFKETKCIGCNGCVNLCPENAIYSKRTKNHVQYKIYRPHILGN